MSCLYRPQALRYLMLVSLLTFSHFTAAESWLVATDDAFQPYVYKQDGAIKGIHFDIVDAVMKQLGVDYELAAYPWARVVSITDQKKVDFSFPWVGKPERFRKYLMTGPIHHGRTVFAIRRLDKKKYQFDTLEDLRGLKIGTVRGYAYDKNFDQADYIQKDDNAKDNVIIISKLVNKRLNMIIGDENVLTEEARNMGVLGKIYFLPKPLKEALRYAAFPKGNEDKSHRFEQALNAIKENGTYEKILQKYR